MILIKLLNHLNKIKLLKIIKVRKLRADNFYGRRMKTLLRKDYFSTFEVARLCNVSVASVNRWIKSSRVDASRTIGGHQRISLRALHSLLKELNMPVPRELKASGIKALIIDDDPAMRKLLSVFLHDQFQNLEIDEASDGFEAGLKLMSQRPDLVTLDIKMPGMDGFAVCEKIKETRELEHTKIVVISGQKDSGIEQKVKAIGADSFLLKPVRQEVLKSMIVDLFGESVDHFGV